MNLEKNCPYLAEILNPKDGLDIHNDRENVLSSNFKAYIKPLNDVIV